MISSLYKDCVLKLDFKNHKGRPGKVGGSLPRSAGLSTGKTEASKSGKVGGSIPRNISHSSVRSIPSETAQEALNWKKYAAVGTGILLPLAATFLGMRYLKRKNLPIPVGPTNVAIIRQNRWNTGEESLWDDVFSAGDKRIHDFIHYARFYERKPLYKDMNVYGAFRKRNLYMIELDSKQLDRVGRSMPLVMVGYVPKKIDPSWGAGVQNSFERFLKHYKISLPNDVRIDMVKSLRKALVSIEKNANQ
jgi:hypothetical protein